MILGSWFSEQGFFISPGKLQACHARKSSAGLQMAMHHPILDSKPKVDSSCTWPGRKGIKHYGIIIKARLLGFKLRSRNECREGLRIILHHSLGLSSRPSSLWREYFQPLLPYTQGTRVIYIRELGAIPFLLIEIVLTCRQGWRNLVVKCFSWPHLARITKKRRKVHKRQAPPKERWSCGRATRQKALSRQKLGRRVDYLLVNCNVIMLLGQVSRFTTVLKYHWQ